MIRSPELDLLALSDTDIECLTDTWNKFGSECLLRDYTHTDACPEWEDPMDQIV